MILIHEIIPDLLQKNKDRFGWSTTLNHDGSLLAVGRINDDGKNDSNSTKNVGAVNLFKFMDAGSIVSAATGKATYVGTIGYGYDYLDTSDTSEHSVNLDQNDLFGRSVAFDKDASHLAVGFNDKSSPGSKGKPGAVHLYTLTADLASATLVATVGDGILVIKM